MREEKRKQREWREVRKGREKVRDENRKEGGEDEEVEGDRRLVVAERGREEIGRGDRKRREGVGG